MENTIQSTYEYSRFKFGKWNRDIKEKNLHKLDKEVKKNGWKKHPIMVNENFEIIDGQHRLVYARTHNLPVYYTVIDGLNAQDCVIMNNTRTAWALEDYIKLYVSHENENYIRLQELMNEYDFLPTTVITSIIKGSLSGGSISGVIKNGKFVITPLECMSAKSKLDFIAEVFPYLQSAKGRLSAYVFAVAFCYDLDNVNKKRLKKQIKEHLGIMTPPANIEMAMEGIEKVYNYKILASDYVYIANEYQKYAKQRMIRNLKFMKEK